jgi:hypothetical protein
MEFVFWTKTDFGKYSENSGYLQMIYSEILLADIKILSSGILYHDSV